MKALELVSVCSIVTGNDALCIHTEIFQYFISLF